MRLNNNRIPPLAACLLCAALLMGALGPAHGWKRQAAGVNIQGPGITDEDIRTLIYADNIPGFHEISPVIGGDGPHVQLDLPRSEGSIYSRIEGRWRSNDELNSLEIHIMVYQSQETARDAAQDFVGRGQSFKVEMPTTERIGDASWMLRDDPNTGVRFFVLGKVFAWVNIIPMNRPIDTSRGIYRVSVLDGHSVEIADTLARGLEWAIRQRPELLAKADTTERRAMLASGNASPGVSALTFRSITWAPLSALQQAGAIVKWDKKTNYATVSYQGRTLELRPFHREASIDGRKLNLGAAVLIGQDGPVVPLRKVTEALGMKVKVTPKTLKLG